MKRRTMKRRARSEEGEEVRDFYADMVSSTFIAEPGRLKMRFLAVGWALLLLLPFMSLYATIHFLLDNLTEWHRSSSYLGPRVISPLVSLPDEAVQRTSAPIRRCV